MLEYLKANSVKYKESNKSSKIVTKDSKKEKELESVNVSKFVINSYEEEAKNLEETDKATNIEDDN